MTELKYETATVRSIIQEYRDGQLVVPEFQREYIWPGNRAAKLLDSLYRTFPISSLLVWETEDPIEHRRKNEEPKPRGRLGWLIDGQQRVITLSRLMAGDEIAVAFNLKEDTFSRANAATEKDPHSVLVARVWDDDWHRDYRRGLPDDAVGKKIEQRLEAVRAVLDYRVPVVRMIGYDLPGAVEAFKRINSLGVRLQDADLQSAEIALRHSGFIREVISPKLRALKRDGFDRLTASHLFRACAFIAHPDGRRSTPLHDLETNEVKAAWKCTNAATTRALDIIRADLGIADMSVLWSGSLLVPVIALCSREPRPPSQEIAGWLAAAALKHRYSRASGTALDQDLRACRTSDPIRELIRILRSGRRWIWASPSEFSSSSADKSSLLAVFIACMHRGIKDLYTKESLAGHHGLDRHHVFPRAHFHPRDRADTIANIAFVDKESNKILADERPEVYLSSLPPGVLRSQAIPEDKRLWALERAEDFWRARRGLVANALNDFLKSALADRRKIG